jgi:hypothetical protein
MARSPALCREGNRPEQGCRLRPEQRRGTLRTLPRRQQAYSRKHVPCGVVVVRVEKLQQSARRRSPSSFSNNNFSLFSRAVLIKC